MTWDLLVCDLDGTLVGKSEPLDPELVKAFHRARDRGLLISIATGRMPPGAERFRDELGITAPCIFYNGALVRDHEEGRDTRMSSSSASSPSPTRRISCGWAAS
jgi:HAD superfamily hydrolase (TIGR01484 family)